MKITKRKGAIWVAIYTIVFCLTSGIVYGMHCSRTEAINTTVSEGKGFADDPGLDPCFGCSGWVEANKDYLKQYPERVRKYKQRLTWISKEEWTKAGL